MAAPADHLFMQFFQFNARVINEPQNIITETLRNYNVWCKNVIPTTELRLDVRDNRQLLQAPIALAENRVCKN